MQTFTLSVSYFRLTFAEVVTCWRFPLNHSNTRLNLYQFQGSRFSSCVQKDRPILQIALHICECSKEEQQWFISIKISLNILCPRIKIESFSQETTPKLSNSNLKNFRIKQLLKQCTYKPNTEVRSGKHCYHGKAISISYSEGVFVALVYQHTMSMCLTI